MIAIATVQIRLIADSQAEALAAIAALRDSVGSSRVALSSPREGRRGQWLAYGTLQIEQARPPVAEAVEQLRGQFGHYFDGVEPAGGTRQGEQEETHAATGPTARLAATGKTTRLRRR